LNSYDYIRRTLNPTWLGEAVKFNASAGELGMQHVLKNPRFTYRHRSFVVSSIPEEAGLPNGRSAANPANRGAVDYSR
jgi:hypothetical protein